MRALEFDKINLGDEIPKVLKPPISRTTLALFAGASNDHNPIHIDIDAAKAAGMDDVFAHGMLSMAYLGQALTNWASPNSLRLFEVRFCAITHVGDEIVCTGTVIEKYFEGGENRLRLRVQAANQDGDIKLEGEAILAI